ncbi:MAG: hypothetical protein B7Y15_03435 [Bacteroidetes bacterium 24-39-8]|nr:MAG: hypothetical protein B7Y69_06900 [Sphingobacteriia bacterium 35-40-8]OYZ52204.1 MAG: hypothetical protein B7Y15_03435 [Bacteroidetes bacterium 24-39-8]OZA63812.1 MAG: hypothetical protein B7X72_09805 [Sphingobacteriia bacterium 39-39-8]HQR92269.1 PmoA family protein [Sediminibacterium sp.]HQS53886.1 PmoA family protein [Sediminibacterium sp.]
MRLKYFPILLGSMISLNALAQKAQPIQISLDAASQKATIKVNGKLFTEFNYPDSLEKPFLYPILASNGKTITRGFPLNPQPGDPTDHPHHIGLWMNYESVNGLDFWNNSYAIAADKKSHYGWIRTRKIGSIKSGTKGQLSYEADWHNQAKTVLLKEQTSFEFSATENQRIIDRTTTLTAHETVLFADIKDGFLGLRVAHELEMPVLETKKYTDASGIVTTVKATKDSSVTGNYLASNGKQGNAVWATRANWCMLYGKQGTDSTSIVIIDHPSNLGFPTYWHARNYGLFAANPLGQKIFSNGKEALNLQLEKGQSVTFKYRIVIATGKTRLSNDQIQAIEKQFQQVK